METEKVLTRAARLIDYQFPNMTDNFTSRQRSFDPGFMDGFYNAARELLDGIFPKYDDVNSGYSINPDNMMDFSDLDLDKLLWDNKGPITFIAVVGVLSIILTFVGIGWCVKRCCCRDRGCFCERTFDPDSVTQKKTKLWKKITATVFLVLLGLIFLYGIVCCFVTNQAMRRNTKKFPTEIDHALDDARLYFDATNKQIDILLKDNYEILAASLLASGNESGNKFLKLTTQHEEVGQMTTAAVFIDIKNFEEELITAGNFLKNFTLNSPKLKSGLREIFQNLTQNDLGKCDATECLALNTLITNVSSLLENGLDNFLGLEAPAVAFSLDRLTLVMNDLNVKIKSAATVHGSQTRITIEEAIRETRIYLTETAKTLTDALDSVPLEDVADDLHIVDDDLDLFTEIWRDCMILVCILHLCIFGLMTIGLLFGIWGTEPSGEDDGILSKSTGSPMINLGIFFIFLTILGTTCVALAHFIGAGAVGQIVCEAMHNLDNVTTTKLAPKANYQVPPYSTILTDCKANKGAYEAFHLVDAFNITELEHLSDRFPGITISNNFKNVEDSNLNKIYLEKIIEFIESDLRMTSPIDRLSEQVFNSLRFYLNDLKSAKISLDGTNEAQQLTSQLNFAANQLRESLEPMMNDMVTFEKQMEMVSNEKNALVKKMRGFAETVDLAQTSLIGVERALADYVHEQVNHYEEFTVKMLGQRVGECGPVYNAFESTLDAVCVHVVEPVGAFWFSLSIVILTLIPYIIAGWVVATQYSSKYKRGGCRKCCICF